MVSEFPEEKGMQASLEVLAKKEERQVEVPPVPDDLRDQWKDRYGLEREEGAKAKVVRESWWSRLLGGNYFIYGGVGALAGVVLLISLKFGGEEVGPVEKGEIVLRGADDFEPKSDTMTVFIASEVVSFESFAAAREEGFSLQANDVEDGVRILKDKGIQSAVIYEASSGMVTPWDGELMEGVKVHQVVDETDEYDLSESLDRFLKK